MKFTISVWMKVAWKNNKNSSKYFQLVRLIVVCAVKFCFALALGVVLTFGKLISGFQRFQVCSTVQVLSGFAFWILRCRFQGDWLVSSDGVELSEHQSRLRSQILFSIETPRKVVRQRGYVIIAKWLQVIDHDGHLLSACLTALFALIPISWYTQFAFIVLVRYRSIAIQAYLHHSVHQFPSTV